ncbi:hypothetical protein FKV24_014285 [Lysobacter maris]|uniref:Uncharacterized protein n=1 Tax=Marilutibacter maris TaxID=1605891 RepID=A0A508A7U4_9GAMM|nr:hypothetical protein [Lysobacter maris]KAB8173405.1 hypothetical protein FKV24_014285 [Lysobacter maris]
MSQWGSTKLFEVIFHDFTAVVEAAPKIECPSFSWPGKQDVIEMVLLTCCTHRDPHVVQACQAQLTKLFAGHPYARWSGLGHCSRLVANADAPLEPVEEWRSRNRAIINANTREGR